MDNLGENIENINNNSNISWEALMLIGYIESEGLIPIVVDNDTFHTLAYKWETELNKGRVIIPRDLNAKMYGVFYERIPTETELFKYIKWIEKTIETKKKSKSKIREILGKNNTKKREEYEEKRLETCNKELSDLIEDDNKVYNRQLCLNLLRKSNAFETLGNKKLAYLYEYGSMMYNYIYGRTNSIGNDFRLRYSKERKAIDYFIEKKDLKGFFTSMLNIELLERSNDVTFTYENEKSTN